MSLDMTAQNDDVMCIHRVHATIHMHLQVHVCIRTIYTDIPQFAIAAAR